MSTTIGTINSTIPPPAVLRTEPSLTITSEQDASSAAAAGTPALGTDRDAIAPAPIQPLSNRVLATFMQKDIELYGSMFGA